MYEVKPPKGREHDDYYKLPNWTVVDIENVDRFFVSNILGGDIRIDFDGQATPSSEVGDCDALNLSIWLNHDQVVALYRALQASMKQAIANGGLQDYPILSEELKDVFLSESEDFRRYP